MIVLAQESRILPTKLAHPCESDTPIKTDRDYSRSERETHPYKDRALLAVPHRDSKGIRVICHAIVLAEAWSMGR